MKQVLLALLVIVLFGGALYGLLAIDASGPADSESDSRPKPAREAAPPADHIDESSRDALLDILREEGGE